jgi:hypothetical protein
MILWMALSIIAGLTAWRIAYSRKHRLKRRREDYRRRRNDKRMLML